MSQLAFFHCEISYQRRLVEKGTKSQLNSALRVFFIVYKLINFVNVNASSASKVLSACVAVKLI